MLNIQLNMGMAMQCRYCGAVIDNLIPDSQYHPNCGKQILQKQ